MKLRFPFLCLFAFAFCSCVGSFERQGDGQWKIQVRPQVTPEDLKMVRELKQYI